MWPDVNSNQIFLYTGEINKNLAGFKKKCEKKTSPQKARSCIIPVIFSDYSAIFTDVIENLYF